MELKFLGRGAALNPLEGNTSAYFVIENDLFIIDCGENIFERIINKNLLANKDTINLFITHTHSDHVGSIGSLLTYSYYVLSKKVNIIYGNIEHKKMIEKVLNIFGCEEHIYNFVNVREFSNKYEDIRLVKYIKTDHCDVLKSYGIMFDTTDGIIYYSGDTRKLDFIIKILNSKKKIDKIFVDVTSANFSGNVHLYIGTLNDLINEKYKRYIYCMHFNSDECINKALEYGFNVVEVD